MFELFEKWMCRLGRCWNCSTYVTDDGIGGQCIRCGKIHGWLTRGDILYFSKRFASPTIDSTKE